MLKKKKCKALGGIRGDQVQRVGVFEAAGCGWWRRGEDAAGGGFVQKLILLLL
jgi:hypothetical protein